MKKFYAPIFAALIATVSLNSVAQLRDAISGFTVEQVTAAGGWIMDNFDDARSGAKDIQDFYNNTQNLSSDECAPDFSTSSNARMASTCRGRAECQVCYSDAMRKMDFYRRQLGRMSCIFKNTTHFSHSAISFGDSYSGFHGMSGAAWQVQKAKIRQSLVTLKGTYDGKYTEFITGLDSSLKEFNGCENQFGAGDWYEKSGFIYFEFMKEKYKRNE